MGFTHLSEQGDALMVNVGEKTDTKREAVVKGNILMSSECLEEVVEGATTEGDVLGVAEVAGIMDAKRTPDLVPLCRILNLIKLSVDFIIIEESCEIQASCTARTTGKTGVEVGALTDVTAALLTVYGIRKAVDKTIELGTIYLDRKSDDKGEDFRNPRTEM